METTLISSLLGGVKDAILSDVGTALPIAGPVFAALAGLAIGFKIFKRVTGARA